MLTITQAILDYFNARNSTLFINSVEAGENDSFGASDVLLIKTVRGFKFGFARLTISEGSGPFNPPVEEDFLLDGLEATITVSSGFSVTSGNPFSFNTSQTSTAYTLTEDSLTALTNNNCFMLIDGILAEEGSLLDIGAELEIEIDSGFVIEVVEIAISGDSGAPFNPIVSEPFTVIENGAKAVLTLSSNFNRPIISNIFTAFNIDISEGEVVGTNKVYRVDSDIMEQVNALRFATRDEQTFDYGQFIIGYIQLPTSIPSELIAGSSDIILGERTLNVQGEEVTTDVLKLDMGTLTIPETFGNLKDFTNLVVNLHLPYANSIIIDPSYIVGEEISIEYQIDLYSGEVTINVSSTKTGGKTFLTERASMGVNIPFIANTPNNITSDNLNVQRIGNNNILKPFVEVVKNGSYLADSFFTIPITDEDLILNQTGFIKVEEVELKVQANQSEKVEILRYLSQGVIINE